MTYKVTSALEGAISMVYEGDDPKYAHDLATMLREEEPSEVVITVEYLKEGAVTMNLLQNIALGDIAYIEQVHDRVTDRKPDEPEYVTWYVVHIEPKEQSQVQTVEVTVTNGQLEEFLISMGWSYKIDDIRHIYQN